MESLENLLDQMIVLRQAGGARLTLLAVCPNSVAVLEAAVKAASERNAPMLFAATLNQVDRDGGYTGWNQNQFVSEMQSYARKYRMEGAVFPCLDHGGPWLKDRHTLERLSFQETMQEVKLSLTACLEAGYQLLHIDPTVDRTLLHDQQIPIETVVNRTVALIEHSELERKRLGLSRIAYEVGTEEVHGGLVELENFSLFLRLLKHRLADRGLGKAWPRYIVAQVGTDLHTTTFDPSVAEKLTKIVAPLGSLIKGHYSDWVGNPEDYPASGMGGANVGPEFTSEEYLALEDLSKREAALSASRRGIAPSNFMIVLERAVFGSGRWKKWLQPDEQGKDYASLHPERRSWLAQTGARYVWTDNAVREARNQLYENLAMVMPDPHAYVIERIAQAIDRYLVAFNLVDSLDLFR